MKQLLPILLLLVWTLPTTAQQFLRIEKTGKVKTEKIPVGTEITYRLRGDRTWRVSYIERLILEENIVVLADQFVRLEDIEALRFSRKLARPLGYKLYQLAAAWTLYGGVSVLVSDYEPGPFDYSVVGGGLLGGFVLERLLRHRTRRFGKRYRLRIVDLKI